VDEGSKVNTDQMKRSQEPLVDIATGKWRKLTDNDCQVAEGKRDQQVGRIEERYAIAREEAQRQVADFERRNVRF